MKCKHPIEHAAFISDNNLCLAGVCCTACMEAISVRENKWHKFSEKMPEQSKQVLIYDYNDEYSVGYVFGNKVIVEQADRDIALEIDGCLWCEIPELTIS